MLRNKSLLGQEREERPPRGEKAREKREAISNQREWKVTFIFTFDYLQKQQKYFTVIACNKIEWQNTKTDTKERRKVLTEKEKKNKRKIKEEKKTNKKINEFYNKTKERIREKKKRRRRIAHKIMKRIKEEEEMINNVEIE